jgi:hypothetical protein
MNTSERGRTRERMPAFGERLRTATPGAIVVKMRCNNRRIDAGKHDADVRRRKLGTGELNRDMVGRLHVIQCKLSSHVLYIPIYDP